MQPITLRGKVIPYKGNGRKLGYPTANLNADTDLKDGVYFGFANLGEFHDQPAIVFVGVPLSVNDTGRHVEAHLLDIPDQDYYGQDLTVTVGHFHRENRAFANLEELMVTIREDVSTARHWFTKKPSSGNGQT
jgi:riboflavin kinase/FMN adenylyltransferase